MLLVQFREDWCIGSGTHPLPPLFEGKRGGGCIKKSLWVREAFWGVLD